jgi:hypothetical protein
MSLSGCVLLLATAYLVWSCLSAVAATLLRPLEKKPCPNRHRLSLCGVADAKAQLKRCSWQ